MTMQSDSFHAPANSKLLVWYGSVGSHYDMRKVHAEGEAKLYESDTVWFDAVNALYGNVRVEWTPVGTEGYRCKLENGEVFEP